MERPSVVTELDDTEDLLFQSILPAVAAFAAYLDNEDGDDEPLSREEVIRARLSWERHAQELGREAQFKKYYRMSRESFEKLVKIVDPHLPIDFYQSMRRTSGLEPLTTAAMLQCCLSWLAGGSYHHIRVITGVSTATFYRIVHRVLDAINAAPELQLVFPVSEEEMATAAAGFTAHSSNGIISGCIGAIDGWLCPIRVPRKLECGRVVSFFSGHYQRYGLNVQACADHNCRFTAFSVKAPGGMNDALAFKRWDLSAFLSTIRGPYFVVGDNAYTQSSVVMTPFNKAQTAGHPERDSYNFYVSQLRIRVEMAFGLLVNKWRIFKSPLAVSLSRCPAVVSACMRLHNFGIDERISSGTVSIRTLINEVQQTNGDDEISYTETVSTGDENMANQYGSRTVADVSGGVVRELLVQLISDHNMHRPARNLARKTAEAED